VRLTSIIIAISLVSNIALADCISAISLNVGDKVTDCPRIGLSHDADLQIRKDLVEGDYNKKIVITQKSIIDLQNEQIDYMQQQSSLWKTDALRERAAYDSERSRNNVNFWIGLGVGILTVVVAGYAIGQVK
jgi:hypothetical protein